MPSRRRRSSRPSGVWVGYFLVLRGRTFAGHALANVGFTGAVLIGVTPIWGQVMATVAAGVGMSAIGIGRPAFGPPR